MMDSPETLEAPPLGTRLTGRATYELVRFLGAGAMGAVYEAIASDGNRYAVKVILQEALRLGGPMMYERFRREADVTATLDNPNILRTVDAGLDPQLQLPFMVMPLLVGIDLDELMGRLGPIHPYVAARIARQMCAALDFAHRLGVVHRDIKPANIYLDHDRAENITVRVLDFGIAKWRSEETKLTRTASLLGTPLFMSPEQTRSAKHVDPRSDVWAVGVTLYAMLADTMPFPATENLAALYVAIVTRDVPPLQDVAPWIAPSLASVVHGALIRDPDKRCPSAAALAAALAVHTGGSDALSTSLLTKIAPESRGHRAPRAAIPAFWGEVDLTAAPIVASPIEEEEADPLLGQTLADRYTILRCIGRGGMGAVYEAHGPDGNRYALKVITSEGAGAKDVNRKRFVREARTVASIQSDHVVRVIDADTDPRGAMPFIVMELLRGVDLDAFAERQGALVPEVAARIFLQACRGLGAAHALGFVHRDIKPANLFLQQTPNGEVVVKICDFGIVKRLMADEEDSQTANLTSTGGVIGSPMYMSPEQAMNSRTADHRTDLWSLGASLYIALAGSEPWAGCTTVGEIIVAACTREPAPIQSVAPWLPPGLAEVVHRAMTRELSERFQTVEEFAAALEPFAGGTVVVRQDDLKAVPENVRSQAAAAAGALATVAEQPAGVSFGLATGPDGRPSALPGMPTGAGGPGAFGAQSVGGGMGSVAGGNLAATVGHAPRTSSTAKLVVAIAAVAALGGGGAFVALRAGSGTDAAPTSGAPETSSDATSTSSAAATIHAAVAIEPATATVTVDGKPRTLEEGGTLLLEGEPGDRFSVALSEGSQQVTIDVTIGKDGKASPDRLELSDASVVSTADPAPKVPGPGGATAKAPPPPTAATQPAGTAKIKPRTGW